MDRVFFEKNRKRLYEKIEDNSIGVFFAGTAPIKRGDERYSFTPERMFYYFTGIDREKLIYLYIKKDGKIEEYLFIERSDEIKAKWVGTVIGKKESKEKSGIEYIKYLDEFDEIFGNAVFNKRIENIYLNIENRYFKGNDEAIIFAEKVKKEYPDIAIKNVYHIASELRTIKSKEEIEEIKRGIDITEKGILAMMKNAKAGMMEYEIEAYFDFELKKRGAGDFAFKSIAASGKNATILHYSKNNCKTEDNELILFDVGAQSNYYNGDITRTFPVNGKFTKRQKEIYNIVLKGQEIVEEAIHPGLLFKNLNEILKEYYYHELKNIGLIEKREEVSKYYYHGVSHFLGLETHDVGRHNEGELKCGMVLTVEPGIYIEEENIGIRIEDDIVVTKDGCEVLSKNIIRTVKDIEKFMQGK